MAYFAKLNDENIVIAVHILSNDVATSEQAGIDFLKNLYNTGDVWKQTSYNTRGGIHTLGGTPLRKNFAGVGYTYDETRDAFIPPKTLDSFILNESTCVWETPVPRPDGSYLWNEANQTWDLIPDPGE
jgi:hypothetical protein